MGNDLVRFIALAVKRPVVVSGNSSGGVLAAWLAAFAMPGRIRGVHCEDPPFFSSETTPLYGHSIRRAAGPIFEGLSKYLGDQWSIGDWEGLRRSRAQAGKVRELVAAAGQPFDYVDAHRTPRTACTRSARHALPTSFRVGRPTWPHDEWGR